MICRLLSAICVVERYRIAIDAYIDGVRGNSLKHTCLETFFGNGLAVMRGSDPDPAISALLVAIEAHLWDVESFFNKRVNFAGMLP
ncbi:hypothetical protein LCGC14_0318730 [marine sediment metagenome]|uniref:Uncharacterized protein n=1 Tax=marine sediment metagenome TaxID=412755 RepID=A0A0F9TQH1_9ZZZZ